VPPEFAHLSSGGRIAGQEILDIQLSGNIMRTTMRTKTIAALAAVLALSTAPQALAQVDDAVLQRLKAVLAEQQIQIEWESVETYANADGDEVTALTNVKTKIADGEVVLPTIELGDVEATDIGWKISSIVVPAFTHVDGDNTVFVNGVQLDGVSVPAEGKKLPYGGMTMYEGFGITEIGADIKGAQVFRLNDFHMTLSAPTDSTPLEFEGAAESMSLDFTTMPDPQAKGMLEQLGYVKMDGFFEVGGSWNPSDGMLSLSKYDLTVNNAGTLGLAFSLGGYTPAFIEQLTAMQGQLAANPGGDNSAAGLAMLGLMQQLSFHSAEISFFDDSLTNKVIELVAKMQNMQPADIKNQAKGMVPFLMMQLNNPELSNMVTAAVTKFVDDPKSLVITAEPAAPVPFAVIMAGAMSAPQTLPQQLGLKVTANE
jgi:hypothetical protein